MTPTVAAEQMGEEANSDRMTDDFSDPEICKPETEGENKEEATK